MSLYLVVPFHLVWGYQPRFVTFREAALLREVGLDFTTEFLGNGVGRRF